MKCWLLDSCSVIFVIFVFSEVISSVARGENCKSSDLKTQSVCFGGLFCRNFIKTDALNFAKGLLKTPVEIASMDRLAGRRPRPILFNRYRVLGTLQRFFLALFTPEKSSSILNLDGNKCCTGISFYYCPNADFDTYTETVDGQSLIWEPVQLGDCANPKPEDMLQVLPVKACLHENANCNDWKCEAEYRSFNVLMECKSPNCPCSAPTVQYKPISLSTACLCKNT
ncbi:uncharacterized protein LOC106171143 [Lingula anatina]|uniref:Uncharacterized protein LOC106171143 n=1 Tax=Lingula anatina TaxID=7574 RepID=A0A1S3J958_LINAN|nr:uncharacterized protein LOC106171143 [Lingula anatina]|eukprot:XP_013406756.1 uncharacterized protein LOC106171143 [Lingula anatina]